MSPDLLKFSTTEEYREHYLNAYCRSVIKTHDGIRVYFKESRYGHAFWETPRGGGAKGKFDMERAERMDWIKAALESADAELYEGWDKDKKCADPTRRVDRDGSTQILQRRSNRSRADPAPRRACERSEPGSSSANPPDRLLACTKHPL